MPQQVEKWREKSRVCGKLLHWLSVCCCLWRPEAACGRKKNSEQHELEIKVVTEEAIPEELMSLIEKNKKTPFRLTFADQGNCILPRDMESRRQQDTVWKWTGSVKHRKRSISIPVFSDRKKEKKKGDCNLSLCSSGTRRDRKKYPV